MTAEQPITTAERRLAAAAHLCALLSVLPLLGLFPTVGIYNRQKRTSPWVAQQAVQAALFQVVTFNVILVLLAIVVPAALGWVGGRGMTAGDLVLAVALTVLPFLAAHYLAQGVLAMRAARSLRTGEDYRYRWIGKLVGPAVTERQL